MPSASAVVRLIGPPHADGEYVVLRTAESDEEIVHLHDYERLYAESGLYELIVQDLLGCRSPQVAVEGLGSACKRIGVDPGQTVLLDLGAGTGIVGELAAAAGFSYVIGLDAIEAARVACQRDRPDVYREYLVGDITAPSSGLLARLRRHSPTALISAGAMGGKHAPPAALVNALGLLAVGSPVVFTIDERWMQTDAPGGFRTPITQLLTAGRMQLLRRARFLHRVSTTGTAIHYELFVAAKADVDGVGPRGLSVP